jgi:hypothetical protein
VLALAAGTLAWLAPFSESPAIAGSDPLSPVAHFSRCYSALTGKRALPTHPAYRAVKSGTLSADEACARMMNEVTLGPVGQEHEGKLLQAPANGALLSNDERQAVLENFYLFHRTWFESNSTIASISRDFSEGVHLLHDQSVGALYITRALFLKNAPYSSVVTLDRELEALRSRGAASATTRARNCYDAQERLTGTHCGPLTFSGEMVDHDQNQVTPDAPVYEFLEPDNTPPLGVQLGEFQGVRPLNPGTPRAEVSIGIFSLRRRLIELMPDSLYTLPDSPRVDRGLAEADFKDQSFRILEHEGGGILGSKSHLLLNFGRPDFKPNDGGLNLYRRWSKAIYSDLLCRELPVLRPNDVTAQAAVTDITPSYRTSRSCMQCHEALDSMAGTRRNDVFLMVSNRHGNQYRDASGARVNVPGTMPPGCHERSDTACTTYHMVRIPPTLASESDAPVDQDPDFFRRPPKGKLHFRSFSGALVNDSVTGPQELGDALAKTDDLYACAASRYFRFLTGIDVTLDDLGAPGARKLAEGERAARTQVIELGRRLKEHQSTRELVLDILRSPAFKNPSMEVEIPTAGAATQEGAP